ncbi:MAG TPA: hypothetical protein VMD28_06180, partial [Acidimicrobiales bacterium]|nr:hypothetical protein [Acidimicrobiales bacterium]
MHVEKTHRITVTKMEQLDVGAFRIDWGDSRTSPVAPTFSAARPCAAADGDLAVLRPSGDAPSTVHDGQSVLLTGFVKQVPRAAQPPPRRTLALMTGLLNASRCRL